jgi:2-phosphosulfolactate phosphatase
VSLLIDVALTPDNIKGAWKNKIWLVVDVLRATSTIVTLLAHGCKRVYTVSSIEASRALSKSSGGILCGERDGLTLPGFEMGNSPCEARDSDIRGKLVILTTTNGTKAIKKVAGAKDLIAASFLNAGACCEYALITANDTGQGIGILCAGERRRFVLDDAYCAGYLAETLKDLAEEKNLDIGISDACQAVIQLYNSYPDPIVAFKDSGSGRRLLEIERKDDLYFCGKIDKYSIIPLFQSNSYYYFEKAWP